MNDRSTILHVQVLDLAQGRGMLAGCPTFWHLWATLEEELSGHTLNTQMLMKTDEQKKKV